MLNRVILIGLYLLSQFSTHAQHIDSVKASMRKMAEAGGYGIVMAEVDGNMMTANAPGFTGLYEIVLGSNRLDTVFQSRLFQSPESRKALMQIAQQLVGKGVVFRKSQKYKEAFYCYRFPLYAVSEEAERTGGRIISSNMWILKEELKHEERSSIISSLSQLLLLDGAYLLDRHEAKWIAALQQKEPGYEDVFVLYRRILDFAGKQDKGAGLVIQSTTMLSAENLKQNEVFVTALIEQLSQTSYTEFTDHDTQGSLTRLWKLYRERGNNITQANVSFFRTQLSSLWRHLNLQRLRAVNIGGPTGHQYSYIISGFMQEPGRQIMYYDMLLNKPLDALATSEAVKSRAFNDWMARSHPNRMIRINSFASVENPLKVVSVAGLGDIYDAADSANAPILSYMLYEDLYFTWLVLPGGKVYYNAIRLGDSLLNKLFSFLPYQLQPSTVPGQAKLGNRGFGLRRDSSAAGQATLLKELWKKLLPDSISKVILEYPGDKLVIIPDGVLNFIPFAALLSKDGKYLAEYKKISYWPSVTSWRILKDAEHVFGYGKTAVEANIMGDAVFSSSYLTTINGKKESIALDPLPGTAVEAKQVASLFNATPLLKEAVNKTVFAGRKKFNILHLATHGYLNTEDAMQSFVALSDGPLYAADLYNENILVTSRMVVLSACQTGLGDFNSDNPLSLSNSFLISGANSVVSSLWSVNDEATTALMISFYDNIKKGADIPTALQAAQVELLRSKKWQDAYFWAAFKITGLETNPLK